MARLRTAMDTEFWDVEVATPRVVDGVAKVVPGETFPMDGARASRAFRFHQVAFLRNGFPLGLIPSYSPSFSKDSPSSFSLQSLFLQPVTSNWWLGLIGQVRPMKLFSSVKTEFNMDDTKLQSIRNSAKHFLEKSLYSLGLSTQFTPIPSTSMKWTTEIHGEKEGKRHKLMLFHQLKDHDISVEAAWPQLFLDSKGQYWDVPESISMDIFSVTLDSPLQYRLGLHKNTRRPIAVSATSPDADAPPASLMPGLCAKASVSYEKGVDLWRREETIQDLILKTEDGLYRRPSYDTRLKEPHVAISGIIGGYFATWLGRKSSVAELEGCEGISVSTRKRNSADLYGSASCTLQYGGFRNQFGDLTRLDARLDISSASALAKMVRNVAVDSDSAPRLNLIFQQQLLGPIALRLDSRVLLDSSLVRRGPLIEDYLVSLTYSFRPLESGKAVFWYSPKRKEGMVELRLFEF